jgi:hypothetical protein
MPTTKEFTIKVTKERGWWYARCLDFESSALDIEDAVEGLGDDLAEYLEEEQG